MKLFLYYENVQHPLTIEIPENEVDGFLQEYEEALHDTSVESFQWKNSSFRIAGLMAIVRGQARGPLIMSILVDHNTRLIVQGITGSAGKFHAEQCLKYGTQLVGGVTPGRGGESVELDGRKIPVFNTADDAVRETAANATCIFVPAAFAADAILEAGDAGIEMVVAITEGIPALDMVRVKRALQGTNMKLVGPNCPGVITPGACKIGIMPGISTSPARSASSAAAAR